MTAKRILVTGGTGAVGSWVLRELLARDIQPIALSRRFRTDLIPDIKGAVEPAQADLLDQDRLRQVFAETKPDAVIHLAAFVGTPAKGDLYSGVQANVEGTNNVLVAARDAGVKRFVYVSSRAVYGAARGEHAHPTYLPVPEDYPTQPHLVEPIRPPSLYGAGKLLGECLALHTSWQSEMESVVMRLCPSYYPGYVQIHGAKACMVHCQMIENAMLGKKSVVPVGGDQRSDVVYGRDAAWLFVQGATQEQLRYRVYNAGSGEGTTLKELAAVLRNQFPNTEIEVGPGEDYLQAPGAYSILDMSRAREDLGYEPKYRLAEAVADYTAMTQKLGITPTYSPHVMERMH